MIILGLAGTEILLQALKDAVKHYNNETIYLCKHSFSINSLAPSHNECIDDNNAKEYIHPSYYSRDLSEYIKEQQSKGIDIQSFTQGSNHFIHSLDTLQKKYKNKGKEEIKQMYKSYPNKIPISRYTSVTVDRNNNLVGNKWKDASDTLSESLAYNMNKNSKIDLMKSFISKTAHRATFLHDTKVYFVACEWDNLIKNECIVKETFTYKDTNKGLLATTDGDDYAEWIVNPYKIEEYSTRFNEWLLQGNFKPCDYVVTDCGPGYKTAKENKILRPQDSDDLITLLHIPKIENLYISDELPSCGYPRTFAAYVYAPKFVLKTPFEFKSTSNTKKKLVVDYFDSLYNTPIVKNNTIYKHVQHIITMDFREKINVSYNYFTANGFDKAVYEWEEEKMDDTGKKTNTMPFKQEFCTGIKNDYGVIPGGAALGKPAFQFLIERNMINVIYFSDKNIAFTPAGFRGPDKKFFPNAPPIDALKFKQDDPTGINPVTKENGVGGRALMSLLHVLVIPVQNVKTDRQGNFLKCEPHRIFNALTLKNHHEYDYEDAKRVGEKALNILKTGGEYRLGSLKFWFRPDNPWKVKPTDMAYHISDSVDSYIESNKVDAKHAFHVWPDNSIGYLHMHVYDNNLLTINGKEHEHKNVPVDQVKKWAGVGDEVQQWAGVGLKKPEITRQPPYPQYVKKISTLKF